MTKYKISKNGVGSIPKGETSIDDRAFKMCKKLTSIVIPDGVVDIGSEAFYGCTNLKEITIPNTVEYIGFHAFSNCTELTSLTLPEKVKKIYPYTFVGCGNLRSIRVDERNKHYDSRNNCNAIIETESNTLLLGCGSTFIPNTVTKIGQASFERCKNLVSILIPRSVTSIESAAFAFCSSLRSIDIPDSIVSIGQEAFYRCENLTTVNLPENGLEIANDAFEGCPRLNASADKEDKVTVTFTYEGELVYSIAGECTLELTVEELKLFKEINQQAKDDDADDILAYFEEKMPQSLFDKIDIELSYQIRYQDSKEMIENEGLDCFPEMSRKVYNSMTKEELIERYMDDNCDGLYEYLIERIEINE